MSHPKIFDSVRVIDPSSAYCGWLGQVIHVDHHGVSVEFQSRSRMRSALNRRGNPTAIGFTFDQVKVTASVRAASYHWKPPAMPWDKK